METLKKKKITVKPIRRVKKSLREVFVGDQWLLTAF